MSSKETKEPESNTEQHKLKLKPPAGKSLLTHQRTGQPPPDSEAAEKVKAETATQPKISSRLASISSMRNSRDLANNPAESPERNAASSLPEAMSKVSRSHRLEKMKRDVKASKKKEKASEAPSLIVGDPAPKPAKAWLWYVFHFGRHANGVLLTLPLWISLSAAFVVALASVLYSFPLWIPGDPGPGSFLNDRVLVNIIGMGILTGLATLIVLSLIIHAAVSLMITKLGYGFGLKVLTHALIPPALFQLVTGLFWSLQAGETFWRGGLPPDAALYYLWLLPLAWGWGGLRIGQALSALLPLTLLTRWTLKLFSFLIWAGLTWGLGYWQLPPFQEPAGWVKLEEAARTGEELSAELLTLTAVSLNPRDTERWRTLYLQRFQFYYRGEDTRRAREEGLRLYRRERRGTAYNELAQGLIFMALDRTELALPKFHLALELDPDCLPAHRWLALAHAGTDPEIAEHHAVELLHASPTVFHLQLAVRLLYARGNYEGIWDAMLQVEAPPRDWDAMTLYQGGVAARNLGREQRAGSLLTLAREKGHDFDDEI